MSTTDKPTPTQIVYDVLTDVEIFSHEAERLVADRIVAALIEGGYFITGVSPVEEFRRYLRTLGFEITTGTTPPVVVDAGTTRRVRPFAELRSTGLLWLINAAALHPRGYSLAFVPDANGTLFGWSLLGDGTEPWQFADTPDVPPEHRIDALHRAVTALFGDPNGIADVDLGNPPASPGAADQPATPAAAVGEEPDHG